MTNHQYHTSSWLDEKRGTGFPSFLFDKSLYYNIDLRLIELDTKPANITNTLMKVIVTRI